MFHNFSQLFLGEVAFIALSLSGRRSDIVSGLLNKYVHEGRDMQVTATVCLECDNVNFFIQDNKFIWEATLTEWAINLSVLARR